MLETFSVKKLEWPLKIEQAVLSYNQEREREETQGGNVSAEKLREVAWLLMLIPFGIVLGTGFFFMFCAWRRSCYLRLHHEPRPSSISSSAESFNVHACVFEQPSRWLVVKTGDPAVVQAALKLRHPTPCSWEEGLNEAKDDKLFISQSIAGWVLVAGSGLPGPTEDVDDCYRFLTDLSRKLGQVQFFSSSRVVNQHAWALVEKGQVFRAYAWAGETLWNQGPLTAAERDLGMRCFDYGCEPEFFSIKDDVAANAERVGQLAARWSFDPFTLGPNSWTGRGVVGDLSHTRSL